jgi:hypothetical protein
MAVDSRSSGVKTLNKIEVINWLQVMLIFKYYKLICIDDLCQLRKKLIVDVVQIYASDNSTELTLVS